MIAAYPSRRLSDLPPVQNGSTAAPVTPGLRLQSSTVTVLFSELEVRGTGTAGFT
jgi:hypothetical protein